MAIKEGLSFLMFLDNPSSENKFKRNDTHM